MDAVIRMDIFGELKMLMKSRYFHCCMAEFKETSKSDKEWKCWTIEINHMTIDASVCKGKFKACLRQKSVGLLYLMEFYSELACHSNMNCGSLTHSELTAFPLQWAWNYVENKMPSKFARCTRLHTHIFFIDRDCKELFKNCHRQKTTRWIVEFLPCETFFCVFLPSQRTYTA